MYIRGPCVPRTPPSSNILTYAEVLAYAYITVKFRLRSSINVPLTESSLYNSFCIERSPKMGFWGGFWGVGPKIIGGNPLRMQRPPTYAFSDIFGSDLTRCAVPFCMDIAICHRRKFGQLWGPRLHYQKSEEKSAAERHPFGPSTTTWKNHNHSAM